jgi:two-component system invasion response regulator UvrY
MKTKLTNIIVADDHGIVRRGLVDIIQENWGLVNIQQASTFEQALFYLQGQMDLLILGINMPGGNSISMPNIVKSVQPNIKVLMFSSYDEKVFAPRYLKAGANGYLHKKADEREIINAIRTVMGGNKYISQQMKDCLVDLFFGNQDQVLNPLMLLSDREMEVGLHLAQGKGVLEISSLLKLKMGTISTYKARTFEKLGIKNTVELAEKFKLYAVPQTA